MKTLALIKALDSFNEWRLLKHDKQPDPLEVTTMIEQASDRLTDQHLLLERCYDLLHSSGADAKLLSDILTTLEIE